MVDGSHSVKVRMSFARSVTGSAMHLHSFGHGLSLKLIRKATRRKIKLPMMTCVSDFTVVLPLKC